MKIGSSGTGYEEMCAILGELWLEHRDDDVFADYFAYNDIGLPAAYMISEDIVLSTPTAEKFIREAWTLLLDALGMTDQGWGSLGELLNAATAGDTARGGTNFCGACGTARSEGAKFCHSCGAAF